MVRQFLRKRAKIARGLWNTRIAGRGEIHDDRERWDELLYAGGVSDSRTLSPKKSLLSARYHYNSVELQILRHLVNSGMEINGCTLLDLGSGAGHWIDFYRSLGAARTTGVDISRSSAEFLKSKYRSDPEVTILCGKASEVLTGLNARFDIVNAIGVMFHVVDDSEWTDTIEKMAALTGLNGMLLIGGHFGFFDGVNVQIDANGHVNKRLRSKKRWQRVLAGAGFRQVRIYRNNAYLWINDVIPENHLLVATR